MLSRRGAALVVALVVFLSFTPGTLALSTAAEASSSPTTTTKSADNDALAKVEKFAKNVESIIKANKRLLSVVGGSLLLAHGQVRLCSD